MSGVGDTSANSVGIAYDAIVTPGLRSCDEHRHRVCSVHHRMGRSAVIIALDNMGKAFAFPNIFEGGIQREEKTNPRTIPRGSIVPVTGSIRVGGKHDHPQSYRFQGL